jgi:hypothetical protein
MQNLTSTQIEFFRENYTEPKSEKTLSGGCSPADHILSLAHGKYWTVLNSYLLNNPHIKNSASLRKIVNIVKHRLQTGGPFENLDLCIPNQGTKFAYHSHCVNSSTYVLEWSIIPERENTIAITAFGTHENFPFMKKDLKHQQRLNIINHPKNQKLEMRVLKKRGEAIEKIQRFITQQFLQ